MSENASGYSDDLKAVLDILHGIYKNTAGQAEALEENNGDLLERLLDERRASIDAIGAISKRKASFSGMEGNEETENMERSISLLLHDIERLNTINVERAKKVKNGLSEKIKHLNTGKNAIGRGYYKKMPARYGSFIDKKR